MGILKGLGDSSSEWKQKVKVLACETYGADALARSLKAGSRVALDSIDSVAKSLGADKIGEKILNESFEQNRKGVLDSLVVTDEEAVGSCLKFALDHNVLVDTGDGWLHLLITKKTRAHGRPQQLHFLCVSTTPCSSSVF